MAGISSFDHLFNIPVVIILATLIIILSIRFYRRRDINKNNLTLMTAKRFTVFITALLFLFIKCSGQNSLWQMYISK